MKILKQGNLRANDPLYGFTCQKCGCAFQAYQSECQLKSDYRNGITAIHPCPTSDCGQDVFGVLVMKILAKEGM